MEVFEASLIDGRSQLIAENESKLDEIWTLRSGDTIISVKEPSGKLSAWRFRRSFITVRNWVFTCVCLTYLSPAAMAQVPMSKVLHLKKLLLNQ
jgi:hypothetical protein